MNTNFDALLNDIPHAKQAYFALLDDAESRLADANTVESIQIFDRLFAFERAVKREVETLIPTLDMSQYYFDSRRKEMAELFDILESVRGIQARISKHEKDA